MIESIQQLDDYEDKKADDSSDDKIEEPHKSDVEVEPDSKGGEILYFNEAKGNKGETTTPQGFVNFFNDIINKSIKNPDVLKRINEDVKKHVKENPEDEKFYEKAA